MGRVPGQPCITVARDGLPGERYNLGEPRGYDLFDILT